jgi:glycosyltransferase involved in cell wall biosynthesis
VARGASPVLTCGTGATPATPRTRMDDALAAPLFSIVVPTLNVEASLRSCLESIAAQTFAGLEVVLVDGGSTDQTLAIADGLAATLGPRLIVHRGRDRGVYDAMNQGVSLAGGSWLLFLGADDVLHDQDTLARVAAFLATTTNCHLVYGDVMMRGGATRYGGEFDLDRLLFEKNLCHQSVFYRRELFEALGPYNLRYRIWADWDFNIRCFSNPALVIRHMDVVVADYNDLGGLSRLEDPELKRRLPVFILAGIEPTWTEKLEDFSRKLLRRGPKRED